MADTKKKAPKPRRKPGDSLYVTQSEPFTAVVRENPSDGNKTLIVSSKTWYQHQLNKFKPGTKVTLEIHTRKPKRSIAQNSYYWGVYLPIIAKETGEYDLEALHELFKGKFLSEGVVEVLGQKVRKKKSTTDLAIGEFSEYIMSIESETHIEAPPTENYGLVSLREGLKKKSA